MADKKWLADNKVTRARPSSLAILFKRNDSIDSLHNQRYDNFIHVGGKFGKCFNVSKKGCFEKATILFHFVVELVARDDNFNPNQCGFNLGDKNQWHDLAHWNATKFMPKFGQVGRLFMDEGYAATFDLPDSMGKFNFINLVTKYAGEECMVAFNNMIFMTYEQRVKSAAKAFLLQHEEPDNASNRRFIFDLVVGCKSNKYANDEKNRLEDLAGGYRFGQQRNEYDVPDNRDAKSESNLEKFVWDLKTVFCRRAVGNGQYPINEIWVKENPWNTLLASRWELQYVTDYNATHE
jgi:hypothetical protein